MEEILRLFKSYIGEMTDKVNEEGLKYGLLIPDSASEEVVKEAINQYGKDGMKWNMTFHKDFNTVKDAPLEVLVIQQLIHYFTTYGFESLGFYSEDRVYVPNEKLEIPELKEDIELICIKPISAYELSERLLKLLISGIALKEQTVKDIMTLSDYLDKNKFDYIKNREVKIALYDKYNVVPNDPEEFFRYLLFKATGSTLKINNRELISSIVARKDKKLSYDLLNNYVNKTCGYEKLSTIFLRNKDLFLAFKIDKNDGYNEKLREGTNHIINKLRKYAKTYHKPLKKGVLDRLTSKDFNVNDENDALIEALDKCTIFREVRILNGITYRICGNDNVLYKIRNGKSWVSELDVKKDIDYVSRLKETYDVIKSHLVERLREKVEGKTILIPSNVVYAVPTSEKQFNGNIPHGSYVELPNSNLVYGIYWKNLEEGRVDLDLKQMNKTSCFGWDASYRNDERNILFSGDVTDAPLPNGASELFYVGSDVGKGAYLVTVNDYSSPYDKDVPFEFVIANSKKLLENKRYHVLDPNDIIVKIDMSIEYNNRQKVIGMIVIDDDIKFYFNDFSNGNSITSRMNDVNNKAFDYLRSYNNVQMKLNDLLKDAGANVINSKIDENDEEKEISVDLDLSLNNIAKDTIIDLLS